jgi:hypothetical protein
MDPILVRPLPPSLSFLTDTLHRLAEVLHEVFVTSEGSALNFAKLTALQEAFPYFLVRNALKIPKSTVMAKALQDILVSSPFSSKSLYQKYVPLLSSPSLS